MAIETWIETSSAPAPAITRTRRISSVAYADDEIASELKIASAFFFDRRSSISSSFESGRPNTTARMRASALPRPVRGTDAASRATSWLGPVYRKNGACGRSTRTRRSPAFRPWSGRRPPITTPSRSQSRWGRGRRRGPMTMLSDADGLRSRWKATPAVCAQTAPVKAAASAASRKHSVTVTATPARTSAIRDVDLQERTLERVTDTLSWQPRDGPIHRMSVATKHTNPERSMSANCTTAIRHRSISTQYSPASHPDTASFGG